MAGVQPFPSDSGAAVGTGRQWARPGWVGCNPGWKDRRPLPFSPCGDGDWQPPTASRGCQRHMGQVGGGPGPLPPTPSSPNSSPLLSAARDMRRGWSVPVPPPTPGLFPLPNGDPPPQPRPNLPAVLGRLSIWDGCAHVTCFQPFLGIESFIITDMRVGALEGGSEQGASRGGGQVWGVHHCKEKRGFSLLLGRVLGQGGQPSAGEPAGDGQPHGGQRCSSSPTNLQMSRASSSGSSKAAKWPPRAM